MKIKALAVAVALAVVGVMSAFVPAMAVVCPSGSEREGQSVNSYAECSLPEENTNEALVPTVVRVLNVVVGVITVVTIGVIIIGGVFYVISVGDAAKLARAKNTIMYGIIGLIVSLLAFAIVNFVVSNIFSGDSGGSTQVVKPGAQNTGKDSFTTVPDGAK